MQISCKDCGSFKIVRNGKARRHQRYKCKSCGLSFIEGDRRQKTPIEAQALAVLLYGMGKSSYGFIAKLFKVSRTAVYQWIRNFCEDIPPPIVPEGDYDLEFDEMWHFINSKKTNSGYGKQWIVLKGEPLPGLLAIVMLKPSKNFTIKSNM